MDRRNLTVDDVELLKCFFLRAMRQGWAYGAPKISIPELPEAKAIAYRDKEKELYLLDWYFAPSDSQNNASAGTTMIWHQGVPVWVMHYGGEYRQEEIPFLKAALRQAYELSIFWGGRGEPCFSPGIRLYINQLEKGSTFDDFKGREMIIDPRISSTLGWHDYWGKLL